jgi:hypothetical protein
MSQPEEVEDDLLCKVIGLGQVVASAFWSGRSERTFWDSQSVEALALSWILPIATHSSHGTG